jgi:hypothetical protein
MPRIFVDGQEYTISNLFGETTVGDLLTDLMTSLASSQKMISEVNIDGFPLTEDSLRHTTQQQTVSVETIALKTMTYGQLGRFGLQHAVLLGQEVTRQVETSAEHFRAAPRQEANRVYGNCLDDLQLLVDVVDQTLKLQDGLPRHGCYPGREILEGYLHKLATITGELLIAYRRDDVMVVADLLTYELVPLLKDLHRGLEVALTQMEAN